MLRQAKMLHSQLLPSKPQSLGALPSLITRYPRAASPSVNVLCAYNPIFLLAET